jgi:hypothetical protein
MQEFTPNTSGKYKKAPLEKAQLSKKGKKPN